MKVTLAFMDEMSAIITQSTMEISISVILRILFLVRFCCLSWRPLESFCKIIKKKTQKTNKQKNTCFLIDNFINLHGDYSEISGSFTYLLGCIIVPLFCSGSHLLTFMRFFHSIRIFSIKMYFIVAPVQQAAYASTSVQINPIQIAWLCRMTVWPISVFLYMNEIPGCRKLGSGTLAMTSNVFLRVTMISLILLSVEQFEVTLVMDFKFLT